MCMLVAPQYDGDDCAHLYQLLVLKPRTPCARLLLRRDTVPDWAGAGGAVEGRVEVIGRRGRGGGGGWGG